MRPLLLVLAALACRRPGPAGRASAFEDARFKLSVPPGYAAEAGEGPGLRLKLKIPRGYATVGELLVAPDPVYASLSVPEAALADARELVKDDGIVLGGTRTFAAAAGECAGYTGLHVPPACFSDDGGPAAGGCLAAGLVIHCQAPSGRRYLVTADLGFVPSARGLAPEAAALAAADEGVVASLAFK